MCACIAQPRSGLAPMIPTRIFCDPCLRMAMTASDLSDENAHCLTCLADRGARCHRLAATRITGRAAVALNDRRRAQARALRSLFLDDLLSRPLSCREANRWSWWSEREALGWSSISMARVSGPAGSASHSVLITLFGIPDAEAEALGLSTLRS